MYGVLLARAVRWTRDRLLAPPVLDLSATRGAEFWVCINSLAVALYQLQLHLLRIEDLKTDWVGDIAKVGREYLDAADASGLKDLRDVMQHTDRRIDGGGQSPQLAPDPSGFWGAGGSSDGGYFGITYLGASYELFQPIDRALQLEPILYARRQTYFQ